MKGFVQKCMYLFREVLFSLKMSLPYFIQYLVKCCIQSMHAAALFKTIVWIQVSDVIAESYISFDSDIFD